MGGTFYATSSRTVITEFSETASGIPGRSGTLSPGSRPRPTQPPHRPTAPPPAGGARARLKGAVGGRRPQCRAPRLVRGLGEIRAGPGRGGHSAERTNLHRRRGPDGGASALPDSVPAPSAQRPAAPPSPPRTPGSRWRSRPGRPSARGACCPGRRCCSWQHC